MVTPTRNHCCSSENACVATYRVSLALLGDSKEVTLQGPGVEKSTGRSVFLHQELDLEIVGWFSGTCMHVVLHTWLKVARKKKKHT